MQWRLAEKNASMAIWLGKQYLGQSDGANGAKFSLSNNFRGWSEKGDSEILLTVTEDDPITKALKAEMNHGDE